MQGFNVIVGSLVLATLLHVSVLSKSTQEIADGDAGTNSLTFLGSVDGKSFFYERYPARTWQDAMEACNSTNMHLASITSAEQARFLNEIDNMLNYTDNGFWTGGRDSQTVSQFVWETENVTTSNLDGLDFVAVGSFQTCLVFAPRLTRNGELISRSCADPWGTLCEIHHIK